MHRIAEFSLDKVNLGLIVLDKDFNIIIWNAWLVRLTGKNGDEMIGTNIVKEYPLFAKKSYLDILQGALLNGQSRFLSGALHKIFIPPAENLPQNIRQNLLVEPLYDGDEKYVLLQITDMTGHYTRVKQLKNMIKELGLEYEQVKASETISRHQSLHDSLTGLPNRNLFIDRLNNVLNLAKRNGEMLAVMFLDLDGFKEVNDNFGHQVGDQVLQMTAERIKLLLRDSDTLARLGGDEFVLLLPRISSTHDAATVADKIRSVFKQPFTIFDHNILLTPSIGISIYPGDGNDAQSLIKNADMAMYTVKSKGKNDFRFFQADK
ncbi:MAG: diguanylate cyclase [Firmicutes bacterium HGW-Firmicutes-15]|nr:MAG: diguanylate cyclase [Firmicutes bacterium HGW-Firmicutes-15]